MNGEAPLEATPRDHITTEITPIDAEPDPLYRLRVSAGDGRFCDLPERLQQSNGAFVIASKDAAIAERRSKELHAAATALDALAAEVAAGKVESKVARDRYRGEVDKIEVRGVTLR